MYTQFFGNFLLSKSAVPADKLVDALERQSSSYLKLGTLAIHAGLLNASQMCIRDSLYPLSEPPV